MQGERRFLRRQKVGAFLALFGLFQMTFGVLASTGAGAGPVPTCNVLGFEADGDHPVNSGGDRDWKSVFDADPDSVHVADDETDPDDGLQGSSKENDPTTWTCQDKAGGITPAKDNLLRAYFHPDITETDALLALGFVRQDGGTQGDSHVNFEFNQGEITFDPSDDCRYLGRQAGDLLFVFDFPGNAADPANIEVFEWKTTPNDGEWISITLSESDLAQVAAADDNATAISDAIVGGTIPARAFGEVAIDLARLDELYSGDILRCPGFGTASVRARTSGKSFNAALKDFIAPQSVDVSTCGSITIKKTDDVGNALSGVRFELFDNADGTGDAVDECTTGTDGTCTFDSVDPDGDPYYVFEDDTTVPNGYTAATNPVISDIELDFREDLDLSTSDTIVNPRKVGDLEITKKIVDENDDPVTGYDVDNLAGTTFLVYDDDVADGGDGDGEYDEGEEVTIWGSNPAEDATCTIAENDDSCTIEGIATGDYRVTETVWPTNTNQGDDIAVTVTENGDDDPAQYDFVNPLNPLNITLDKSGPDSATIGDTITYTFTVTTSGPRLTNITVEDLGSAQDGTGEDRCDAAPVADETEGANDGDTNADGWLDDDEEWTFACDYTITAGDPDLAGDADLVNWAKASGTDDFGRTVSDEDDHTVTVRYPDVKVDKVADDSSVSTGDDVGFGITVTNIGDGVARSVTLSDSLPVGFAWSIDVDSDDDCQITQTVENEGTEDEATVQTLTCDFGDLAADASDSVHVTASTAGGDDCTTIPNTAAVSSTNEQSDVLGNNSDTDTITVSCVDVTVAKTPDAGTIDAGDTATFTVVVSNESDETAATEVTLTDELPGENLTWTTDDTDCTITDGTLDCSWDSIEAGGSETVTVSAETTSADCAVLDNTATVTAANEDSSLGDDNSDDGQITVVCPPPPPPPVVVPVPEIELDKDGVDLAHRGDEITYTFDITNTGDTTLVTVELVDPICDQDTLTLTDDGDGDSVLAADETWSYTCTYVIADDDPDPLPNTATVTGADGNGNETSDSDSHLVDLIAPDIEIDKTVDDAAPEPGDTITFRYAVTNTGDTTLFDVTVVDDVLGEVGTVDDLAPGETVVLTFEDVVQTDQSLVNVGTATGTDVLGAEVSDEDDEVIAIVLPDIAEPEPVPEPEPQVLPSVLPRTGVPTGIGLLIFLGGLALMSGGSLVAGSRVLDRRR